MSRRPKVSPTNCLESDPSSKSIRLGGRYVNLTRLSEYGFDHGYLSYILSGKRQPSLAYAQKIAKCLGLLTDKNEPDVTGLLQLIEERRNELREVYISRLPRRLRPAQ